MPSMGETLQMNSAGMQCIGAYRAMPAGEPRGGIVVAQEIFGVNAHIRSVVDRFAAHGYVAIAPAFFDHLESGVELDYDAEGIARGRALIDELGIDRAVADVGSAADAIRSAGRIGVVGYCWGGTVALLAAIRLGLPAVSYYGARNVNYLHEAPTAPLLFHFGEQDRSIPAEAVQRHREALPGAEIHVYPAGHGFNCELRKDYDAASAKLAFERTLDFFARTLE
jgi:carboxymethylenebutenolidase